MSKPSPKPNDDKSEFDKFQELAKKLFRIPKREIDAKAKKKRAKKKPAKK